MGNVQMFIIEGMDKVRDVIEKNRNSYSKTDYNTLIPVVRKHFLAFEEKLKEVTADSGYCSEKNLLFVKEHDIDSYIKLQDHEQYHHFLCNKIQKFEGKKEEKAA